MSDVQKLIELRNHHLAEAKRCADAIDLLKDIDRMTARAARVASSAAALAAGDQRGRGRPRLASPSKVAEQARQQREAAKAGTRPIDRVRAVMQTANGAVPVLELLSQVMGADTGANRRALGSILGHMKKRRELREHDGAVTAWKLQPVTPNGKLDRTSAP